MYSSRRSNTPKIFSSISENINTSNRKAASPVTTPALIFYQPHHHSKNHPTHCRDNSRQHSRDNIQESKDQPHCENHSNLQAAYLSRTHGEEEEIIFYCTKCASLLADQGFEVTPISEMSMQNNSANGYMYPEREEEIQTFMGILQDRLEVIEGNSGQIKDILISSEEFYGQQIQQINEYFQAIIQSLELQKNKCYNHILLERQNAEKATRLTLSKFIDSQRQIEAMRADIQDNLDSVFSITWENYRLVLEAFEGRLREVDKVMGQLQSQGINDVEFRKIQFAGVPDTINSLSQIIIQNSFGGGSTLELTDPDDCFSEQSYNQKPIFQQSRNCHNPCETNKSQNSVHGKKSHQRHSSLIFSFDADAMKQGSLRISQGQSVEQPDQPSHGNNFLRKVPDYEEEEENRFENGPIIMRNQRMNRGLFSNKPAQRVEGIQEVQEVDVLEMSEEYLIQ